MFRIQGHAHTRRCLALAGIAALAAVLATPTAYAAGGTHDLVVMTQNLYRGSSLAPLLDATDEAGLVEAIAKIYATVQYTNFPARAEAIADEIEAKTPDIIGLQEVVKWTTEGQSAPPGYDFLDILQGDLVARGLHYSVAVVSQNEQLGPLPLVDEEGCAIVGTQYPCHVTMLDRDVILVNDDTPGLAWSNPQSGHYAAQATIDLPSGPFAFDRGWASIDVQLNGCSFRFVNTRLECADYPDIQLAQTTEFLAGPGNERPVIAVGDFESAADGSTTASYASLTAPGNFSDVWDESELGPGWTCCQMSNTIPMLAPGQLNNPQSTLDRRVDLILTRGAGRSAVDKPMLVGDTVFQAEPPFWPSDHAGVIATIVCRVERAPTLTRYGLGLLAVLLLGVGCVGFRRFA